MPELYTYREHGVLKTERRFTIDEHLMLVAFGERLREHNEQARKLSKEGAASASPKSKA